MYLSAVQIFGLLLITLSKIAFRSSESTVELFSSIRFVGGRSSTCNEEYKFWSSGTVFCLLLKPLLFFLGCAVVQSFSVFLLKSPF